MPRILLTLALALVGCDPPRPPEEGGKPEAPVAKVDGAKPEGEAKGEAKTKGEGPKVLKPDAKDDGPKVPKGGDDGTPKEAKPPIPQEKWGFGYAEKTWGVRLKSMKYTVYEGGGGKGGGRSDSYQLLLEFTKDVPDEELAAMKTAFTRVGLEYVFFDNDSVVVGKLTPGNVSLGGEITGVKGDAFRVSMRPTFNFPGAVKMEIRPVKAEPGPKKKGK